MVMTNEEFDLRWQVEPNTGCWLWLGHIDCGGYGRFSSSRAHRVSYERFKGPIPDGYEIDHLCKQRCCCNPDHLEAVTPRENNLRSESPAAKHARKTHCPRGHAYDEANTMHHRKSPTVVARVCRACARVFGPKRQRRYQERLAALGLTRKDRARGHST